MNMNKFNLCFNNKKNDVLIANFLKTGDNKQFFNNFIENPTEKNKNKLDIAFKNYYREIKIVTYISKLIHFFSIDYDKKLSKYRKRNLLSLDNTQINTDKRQGMEYLFTKVDDNNHFFLENEHIVQSITNKDLSNVLEKLPSKQLYIIDLKYRLCYSSKEIAEIMGLSQQTVSYNLNAAIKKLKKALR